ncbi:hypothetical protein ACNKHK_25430 [Shigella flexneri]
MPRGVDFVLLDQQGQRVGLPVAYRDSRTNGRDGQAQQQLGKRDIYQRSGIQFLPFNTLYQLRALTEQQPELLPHIAHALLMPDYFSYTPDRQDELGICPTPRPRNWWISIATTGTSRYWREERADKAWFGRPTHPGNA